LDKQAGHKERLISYAICNNVTSGPNLKTAFSRWKNPYSFTYFILNNKNGAMICPLWPSEFSEFETKTDPMFFFH
jgi:hypothetical protein